MASTRLYPGMCDDSLEIFYIAEEDRLMVIKNGKISDYDDLSKNETSFLDEIINSEPDVRSILEMWCDDRESQKKKLAECRFGGLNFTPDFQKGICKPDSFNCPLKSSCSGYGIVCKRLVYNGTELDYFDERAIKLLTSSKKNTVIAEILKLPLGSFEIYRTKLYKALNIATKQELASVAFLLGLV